MHREHSPPLYPSSLPFFYLSFVLSFVSPWTLLARPSFIQDQQPSQTSWTHHNHSRNTGSHSPIHQAKCFVQSEAILEHSFPQRSGIFDTRLTPPRSRTVLPLSLDFLGLKIHWLVIHSISCSLLRRQSSVSLYERGYMLSPDICANGCALVGSLWPCQPGIAGVSSVFSPPW